MKPIDSPWLPVSSAISFLVIGIPYWLIPYNKVNLPDALIGPGLLVVAMLALLLRLAGAAPLWRTTYWLGSSVIAVVVVRVIWEVVQKPASHNLWPFEVIIALLVGFTCAFAGAVTGGLIARFLSIR